MAGTVSQYQQSAFTTPVNGDPLDASVVLSNDQAVRGKHNGHDADPTIHIQSSDLASRPVAGTAQRVWWTTDERMVYFDNGVSWLPQRINWSNIVADGVPIIGVSMDVTLSGAMTIGAASVVLGTDASSSLRINATTASTVGAAGGASALPATPTGYLTVNINGTNRKIPYYAT